MPPGEPSPAAIEERVLRGADDIGHLQRWPRHLFGAGRTSLPGEHRQCIQRAGGSVEMSLRDMEIDSRFFEVLMSQQELNGAQVSTALQQMGGKTVAKSV